MGASTAGAIFAIFLVGAVAAVLGLAIDRSNKFFTGLSADASNTIFYLEVAFGIVCILVLIAIIINHWLNEKSQSNMGV